MEELVRSSVSLDRLRDFLIGQEEPSQTLDSQMPSSSSSPASQESFMLGFVIAQIVGIQYYSGTINGRELVGLVREPLNPYDPNAIKVLNMRLDQVGHVERAVAAVLSPLIDSGLISVEGIVPKSASLKGNRYKIPFQIHIFARPEAFQAVESAVSRSGLQLIPDPSAAFGLSEANVVKEKRKKKGGVKSVDEIFRLVDKNVRKKGALEVMEPPKEVIKSELFLHQKEGLGWLMHRENSSELPPFWEEKDGAFVNVLTNYQTDRRPEPLRGGVFADDMGLGKTLTLLSLIAFDKYGDPHSHSLIFSDTVNCVDEMGEEDDELSTVGGKKSNKRGRPRRNGSSSRKKTKTESTHSSDGRRSKPVGVHNVSLIVGKRKITLIVCPPAVFSSWITQLLEHTKTGSLKTYMYYGARTEDIEELWKYDIVLTTYSTLAAEESWLESPIKKIEWWRVILDEAHLIKNVNSQQSRAVTKLEAKRRWVVTGTPIQNGTLDLFSLMAFLRFEPFSVKSYWQSLVQRPLSQGNKKGLLRLQVLMETISLRRTKDKALIGLPPKSVETCFVELSGEERNLYDQLEETAKNYIKEYISDGSLMRNYSTVLSILLRLRQICTDVALCPDLKSLLPASNIEDVSNNPELLQKMVSVLQDGEDLDCPVCISPLMDTIITCCAHLFCRGCILKTLKRSKPCCPLCRQPLSESDLFSAAPESLDSDDSRLSALQSAPSSKVSALLKLLSASREQSPSTKSVVFSQFRKMLLLLEAQLKAAGFNVLRLDGSMNAKKRAQVIEDFGTLKPGGPTVLLASLKASGAGINLTAASRVYLFEPWWNPAVEEQAMDRVHRIGQKEEVKIVRLIARSSIEERILDLQEGKKKLAREAFGRKAKGQGEVSAHDLRILMSL